MGIISRCPPRASEKFAQRRPNATVSTRSVLRCQLCGQQSRAVEIRPTALHSQPRALNTPCGEEEWEQLPQHLCSQGGSRRSRRNGWASVVLRKQTLTEWPRTQVPWLGRYFLAPTARTKPFSRNMGETHATRCQFTVFSKESSHFNACHDSSC